MMIRIPRDDIERGMNALSGLEVVLSIDVDQEEPRSVSTEGQCGGVPGENDDASCFLVPVVAGLGPRRSSSHRGIVQRTEYGNRSSIGVVHRNKVNQLGKSDMRLGGIPLALTYRAEVPRSQAKRRPGDQGDSVVAYATSWCILLQFDRIVEGIE